MQLAIEMFFDEEAESTVRALWRSLASAGLPSLDGDRYRPHVSLAVVEGDPAADLGSVLDAWASTEPNIELQLSHLGRFPESEVAFLGVVPHRRLIDPHERLHARLEGRAREAGGGHYLPGVWVPHCTLAMRIEDSSMSELLVLARAAPLPIDATVRRVGLVEIPSGEVHATCSLSSKA